MLCPRTFHVLSRSFVCYCHSFMHYPHFLCYPWSFCVLSRSFVYYCHSFMHYPPLFTYYPLFLSFIPFFLCIIATLSCIILALFYVLSLLMDTHFPDLCFSLSNPRIFPWFLSQCIYQSLLRCSIIISLSHLALTIDSLEAAQSRESYHRTAATKMMSLRP
jgi:Na+/melibiose symporter-like transporter